MASIVVTAPDPAFAGTRAGVTFADGRAEVDPDDHVALAYFARHGYAIGDPPPPTRRARGRGRAAEPEPEAALDPPAADASPDEG